MRVAELMTDDPISITTDTTIADALELMYARDVRHLPVLEEERLVGILSDRDLRGLFIPDDNVDGLFDTNRLEMRAADLMSANPLSVDPQADSDEVIELMIAHKVGAVPVVDIRTDELVGIVSYIDVLQAARGRI